MLHKWILTVQRKKLNSDLILPKNGVQNKETQRLKVIYSTSSPDHNLYIVLKYVESIKKILRGIFELGVKRRENMCLQRKKLRFVFYRLSCNNITGYNPQRNVFEAVRHIENNDESPSIRKIFFLCVFHAFTKNDEEWLKEQRMI